MSTAAEPRALRETTPVEILTHDKPNEGQGVLVERWLVETVPTWKELIGDLESTCSIPNTNLLNPDQTPLDRLDTWCLERVLDYQRQADEKEVKARDAEDLDTCLDWERQWIASWPEPEAEPRNANRRLLCMIRVAEYLDLCNMRVALRTVMRERLDQFFADFEKEHPESPKDKEGAELTAYQEDWIVDRLDALYTFCGTEDQAKLQGGEFAYDRSKKAELLAMYRDEQKKWD